MDPKIAKKTQDTLGKIIKKPPLTDKLLGKPPFRFLHDIVTSAIKTTGFMKGLYPDADLNSDNVKDKDAKIAFLQKAIDMVCNVTGKNLSVKPAKIVAGHEPEKTNEFLQALAEAINKKVDNDEYVKRTLSKDSKGAAEKPPEKEKEKEKEKERDREKKKDDGERAEKKESRDKGRDKGRERSHKESSSTKDSRESGDKDRRRKETKEEKENEMPDMMNGEKEAPTKLQRPTSAKGSRRRHEGHGSSDEEDEAASRKPQEPTVGEGDLPPQVVAARKMARPPSARPAPPRPKQDPVVDSEPAMRLGTGAPTNVIVDGAKDSDEDETFLVEESSAPPPIPQDTQPSQADAEDGDEHGALVKKMLESKKGPEAPNKRTEIERPAMSDGARRKQREQVQKEIDKLRASIQSVTRSANPLGKIMDYVQEDLDSMQKELEKWKLENREHALALKREKGITNHAIEPLKAQLSELDQAIKHQLDLIAASKSNILQNDTKISKMLRSVSKSKS